MNDLYVYTLCLTKSFHFSIILIKTGRLNKKTQILIHKPQWVRSTNDHNVLHGLG